MVDMDESFELQAPAVVFPGQRDPSSAYRVAVAVSISSARAAMSLSRRASTPCSV